MDITRAINNFFYLRINSYYIDIIILIRHLFKKIVSFYFVIDIKGYFEEIWVTQDKMRKHIGT